AAGGPQQGAPPQALLPEGQTLRSLMGEEDRVEYEAALATLELPPGALDRFDPWFAGINLGMLTVVRKGYNPNAGADMALTKLAQEQGKDRAGLETAEFQLDMFDSTPIDLQLFYLDRTVEQLPRASDTIDTMLADWLAGNTEALAAVMNAGFEDPAAYEWLITRRNRNWAGWIDQRLDQPGVVFVAVGAGHLAGLGSVQEQLDELGIEVERVQ
ncbi:MAG TPA: TraB/GumN family protein, partial [Sphingomonadaceae bacterium]|nr:TraB/GumN family protein [Sphingomonadaceae bacterium]